MRFTVLPASALPPTTRSRPAAYLVTDEWDDWFKYSTTYTLYVVNTKERLRLGSVKIGQHGMTAEQRRPAIPESFERLNGDFFSLGQDDEYYESLNKLEDGARQELLEALRDMAYDLSLFAAAKDEEVTKTSLLRSVSTSTVKGQFNRMAHGGARLSKYAFTYAPPGANHAVTPVDFMVEPASKPPTNIHVLIGRNGVGKTHFLNCLARAIVDDTADVADVGKIAFLDSDAPSSIAFANLISITFSAFDQFEPFPTPSETTASIKYAYIGLRRHTTDPKDLVAPKPVGQLTREFSDSVRECRVGAKRRRWQTALATLESDPIFQEADISSLADLGDDIELKATASNTFGRLSSGHKIVLLTITRLVEVLEERSLVLLDEPEGHLHPPLLSAFIRALSDLMIDRNGVSLIATHSPVVLQEVPKRCVWKIWRVGRRTVMERPEIETFGEGVGVLTREVFGLEVASSGFHRILAERVAASHLSFDDILAEYGGELGDEARALVRSLVAARDSNVG